MRRVFMFTGYHMKVFEWHNRTLLGSMDFTSDEEGFGRFEKYSTVAVPMPTFLLVDVLEEDFRREKMPHVNANDQKFLITRLIDRHYRDNKYTRLEKMGRDAHDNKNDNVLLTALSNIGQLEPWLSLFEKTNVPLCGIYSLPIVSTALLKEITRGEGNILLLSRQMRSATRESFFKDGKIYLSRQARLDRDVRGNVPTEMFVNAIEKATAGIQKFLTNQRLVGFTDILNVYFIIPESQVIQAIRSLNNTKTTHYNYVSLEALFKRFKLKNCDDQHGDALFSYLCSRESCFKPHYGQSKDKVNFYKFLAEKTVSITSALGSIVCIAIAISLGLSSLSLHKRTQAIDESTQELFSEYSRDYGAVESKLGDAVVIDAATRVVDGLKAEAQITPQSVIYSLSSVLEKNKFLPFKVDSFEWEKMTLASLNIMIAQTRAKIDPPKSEEEMFEREMEMAESAEMSNVRQQAIFILRGELNRANLSYRDTVVLVHEFVDAFSKAEGVQHAFLLVSPVDLRHSMRFIDQIGVGLIGNGAVSDENKYEILLVVDPVKENEVIL